MRRFWSGAAIGVLGHPIARRAAAGCIALAAVLGAAVYFFQWNMLRPWIAHEVQILTGRRFSIDGDLGVALSREPLISAEGLFLGNAAWSDRPDMIRMERLEFRLRLAPLMGGKVEIPEIRLVRPRVLIEQDADGRRGNWAFERLRTSQDQAPADRTLRIGRIDIRDGKLEVAMPKQQIALQATFDAIQGAEAREGRIAAHVTGTFRKLPFDASAEGGAVLSLRDADDPYPVKAQGRIGSTRFSADGTVTDVRTFRGMAIAFTLAGQNLAELFPILRLPLPATPPYRLAGLLEHEGREWRFSRFAGKIGNSDIAGNWAVDLGQAPRRITADLTSKRLDLADLSGLIGARSESTGKPVVPKGGKVLPQTPVNLEKLRVADVQVRFRGERIVNGRLPLEYLKASVKLEGGRLRIDPLEVGIADGKLRVRWDMDAVRRPVRTRTDMVATHLLMARLVPVLGENKQVNTGRVGGRASLVMEGDSVARMVGAADGKVALIMTGGEVSKLLLRLANLDIANLVPILLAGDEPVPVRCMVGELGSHNGKARLDSFVLDTEKQRIKGSGGIDFGAEQLDLRLDVEPKDMSLASLRGPILIGGSFRRPTVRPEMVQPTLRTAAAVALAFVTPPLALLPLVEIGTAEDAPCRELIRHATGRGRLTVTGGGGLRAPR